MVGDEMELAFHIELIGEAMPGPERRWAEGLFEEWLRANVAPFDPRS